MGDSKALSVQGRELGLHNDVSEGGKLGVDIDCVWEKAF